MERLLVFNESQKLLKRSQNSALESLLSACVTSEVVKIEVRSEECVADELGGGVRRAEGVRRGHAAAHHLRLQERRRRAAALLLCNLHDTNQLNSIPLTHFLLFINS